MSNIISTKVLKSIALTILHPNDPNARIADCHSVVADYIRTHRVNMNDKIVLLGHSRFVSHSVLISQDNDVLADSFANHNVDASLNKETLEFHYIKNGQEVILNPVDIITIRDFTKHYLNPQISFKDYITSTS